MRKSWLYKSKCIDDNYDDDNFFIFIRFCSILVVVHKMSWVQMSVSELSVVTNVGGHKCWWSQLSVGTNVVGTNVGGHNYRWVQMSWAQMLVVTTIGGYKCRGHKCWWSQLSVGTNVVGTNVDRHKYQGGTFNYLRCYIPERIILVYCNDIQPFDK